MKSELNEICHKFEKALDTPDQEIELNPTFRALTMDIICNIVFGINVDSQVSECVNYYNKLKSQNGNF